MYHLMRPDVTIIEDVDGPGRLGTEATELDNVQLGFIPGIMGGGKEKCRGLPNFGTLPFSKGIGGYKGGAGGFFGLRGTRELLIAIKSGGTFGFEAPQAFDDPFAFSAFESEKIMLNSPGVSLKMGLKPMQTMIKEKLLTSRLDNMQDQVKRQVDGIKYIANRLQAMANWANSDGPTCQSDVDRIVRKIKDWTKAAEELNDGVERDVEDINAAMEEVTKKGPGIELDVEKLAAPDTEFRLAVEGGKIVKKQVVRYKPSGKLYYEEGEGWISEEDRYRALGPMGEWNWRGHKVAGGGSPTRTRPVRIGMLGYRAPSRYYGDSSRWFRGSVGGTGYPASPTGLPQTMFYEVPHSNPELVTYFSKSLKSPLVVKRALSKSTEEIESVIVPQTVYGGLLSGTDDKPCCPLLGQLSPQTRSMLGTSAIVLGLLTLVFIWR